MQTQQKHRTAAAENEMGHFYITEKIQRTFQKFLKKQIEIAFQTRNTMQNIENPTHGQTGAKNGVYQMK
jgi:hypothetical protein